MIIAINDAAPVVSVVVEVVLKTTLVIAAAATATFALKGATATLRHTLWSFALVAMLAIPALIFVLPRWQLGLLPAPAAQAVSTEAFQVPVSPISGRSGAIELETSRDVDPVTTRSLTGPETSIATEQPRSFASSVALLWVGGVIAGLITIGGGLASLRRIRSRATLAESNNWTALVDSIRRDLDISRPVRILISRTSSMPATWGVFNPVVLLPAGSITWDDERKRVVLLHELAHVKRNDSLTQMIAQLCCALYWFHPGAWYTAARVRAERELACDEHVLGAGVNACDYASHLVNIARLCRAPSRTALGAVAMARSSQLEGRLHAILSERAAHWRASGRSRRITVGIFAAMTLPLAAMRPWEDPQQGRFTSDSPSPSPSPTIAPADTFRWTGSVGRGQWVEIRAPYGDLRAEVSRDANVHVMAIQKTGDARSFRIASEPNENGMMFCSVKSSTQAGTSPCKTNSEGNLENGISDVRIDYLVQVPPSVGVSLHTGRGNVNAETKSYVWATSGRGDIAIRTSDLAEASTRSGSISAEFRRRTWKQDLEFYTDSGDVTVVAPSDVSTHVQAETGFGQVRSAFAARTYPSGSAQRRTFTLGQGGGMLTLRTGRGIVELKRGSQSLAEVSDMNIKYKAAPASVDPKPNPNPNAAYDPNPNPDPGFNPDPNIHADVDDDNPTGERVDVKIPANFLAQFSDAATKGWPDAMAVAHLRDIAASHVKQGGYDLVRERSEWALTLVRKGMIVGPLTQALNDNDWKIRAYAAWALGETRSPLASAALTNALGDNHWRVRMHAAAGLQRLGTARSVDPLIRALRDEHWQVRVSAVDALAWIGDRRAVPALETLAQRDPHTAVREEARDAIRRIR